jgi:hypothetical protein
MEDSYAKRIRDAYLRFHKSLVSGTSEHDVRSRFIQHFILKGLGYPEKCYINEKKWADIWLLDRIAPATPKRVLPVVVIETKDINTSNRDLPKEKNIEQAFSYVAPGATRYVALTNFRRFILWQIRNSLNPQPLKSAVADVDIEAEVTHASFGSSLNHLIPICFEEICKVYDDFSVSPNIDLGDAQNFEAFAKIVKWKILDESLIPQFQRHASALSGRYSEFEGKKKNLQLIMNSAAKKSQAESANSDWQKAADCERQLRLLEKSYMDANRFNNCFTQWQRMAYPPDDKTKIEERMERFARETAYTQFSRLLLVRIASNRLLASSRQRHLWFDCDTILLRQHSRRIAFSRLYIAATDKCIIT